MLCTLARATLMRTTTVKVCVHGRALLRVHSKCWKNLIQNEIRKQVRAKRVRTISAFAVQALGEYKASRRHARGARCDACRLAISVDNLNCCEGAILVTESQTHVHQHIHTHTHTHTHLHMLACVTPAGHACKMTENVPRHSRALLFDGHAGAVPLRCMYRRTA